MDRATTLLVVLVTLFVVTVPAELALAQKSPSRLRGSQSSLSAAPMPVIPAVRPLGGTPVAGTPAAVTPVAVTPVAEPRSVAGDLRVAISAGVGMLSVSERYYNTNTYRYEDVVVWSARGGAASLYVGWGVFGYEGGNVVLDLGYRLATTIDGTAMLQAHEVTLVARMGWLFTSLGVGIAGITNWESPGFAAPRFSFSAQFGINVYDELFIAFETGVMIGPGDDNALDRYSLTLGYTF